MDCPFPGMDPWLEHPALWPGVHNSLIIAIRDDLAMRLAPRYFVAVEVRTHWLSAEDERKMGVPDVAIGPEPGVAEAAVAYDVAVAEGARVVEVAVPERVQVRESYLEVRLAESRQLVTAVELLSPANKLLKRGREAYLRKRQSLLCSAANLVEIDLLRAGEPLPILGEVPTTHYRVLVSRGETRPKSALYVFNVPDPIPTIPIPLQPGEDEPALDLCAVHHDAYRRGRLDMLVRYDRPPVPPLEDDLAAWAAGRVAEAQAQAASA